MDIEVFDNDQQEIKVLRLSGRFDAYEAPRIKHWLFEQMELKENRIVVNLADVNFVDSSALAVLVQGMKHCRQQAGDLRICALQSQVRIIFELTRLDRAFEIFAAESEAIHSYNGSGQA